MKKNPGPAGAASIIDKKGETGPFDVIGDIHGCYDELCILLERLGYSVDAGGCRAEPPGGRKAVFLGDYCDRGPKNAEVLRLVMSMSDREDALCILGNHDAKLLRKLRGANVQLINGLDITVRQLEAQPPKFIKWVENFLGGLVSHYVLDGGALVVSHAGIKEEYQGCDSERVRSFCLYGDTTGESDEFGLPVRLNWAKKYHGRAKVIYGHTPSLNVRDLNNTLCIDTGCVFGGRLTACRYPENEILQTPALRQYYKPAKPLDIEHD